MRKSSITLGEATARVEADRLQARSFGADLGFGLGGRIGSDALMRIAAGEGVEVGLRTVGFGREGAMIALSAVAPRVGGCVDTTLDTQGDCLRSIEMDHGFGLTQWWRAQPQGLEQGWTFATRPVGEGALVVELGLEGATVSVDADARGATLSAGGAQVRYTSLLAVDARGQVLPARLEGTGSALRVRIDDTGAAYPVVIDPWVEVWSANLGQVILPSPVASAGDVNGDGYADVVLAILARANQPITPTLYLYYGSATGLDSTPQTFTHGQNMGWDAQGVGDVNGDGYDDVMTGCGASSACLYYGSATGLSEAHHVEVTAPGATTNFGMSLSGGGDVNGDGYADVIVGDSIYGTAAGAAFLYLGSAQGLSSTPSLSWISPAYTALGFDLAILGDADGDGYDDVAIGAFRARNDLSTSGSGFGDGKVYIYPGGPSGPSDTPSLVLSGLNGAQFGYSVAGAGDVNGDGYADMVVGAPSQVHPSAVDQPPATVYVYQGGPSGIDATPLRTWTVGAADDRVGNTVASAGDLNADGFPDVVATSYGFTSSTQSVYVWYGGRSGLAANPAFTWANLADYPSGNTSYSVQAGSVGDYSRAYVDRLGVGDHRKVRVFGADAATFTVSTQGAGDCLGSQFVTFTWPSLQAYTDAGIAISYTADDGRTWHNFDYGLSNTTTSYTIAAADFEGQGDIRVRVSVLESGTAHLLAVGVASETFQFATPVTLHRPELQGDGEVEDAYCRTSFAWAYPFDRAGVTFEVRTDDGRVLASGLKTLTWTPDAPLPAGAYSVSVVAMDCFGSERQSKYRQPVEIRHDPVAPVVSPVALWQTSAPVSFSWTAEDQVSDALYHVIVGGIDVSGPVSGLSFTPASPIALPEGTHKWHVEARSCDDGVAPSNLGVFGIDLTPPKSPEFTSPADGETVGSWPMLTWSPAQDVGSGICGYQISVGVYTYDVGNVTSFQVPNRLTTDDYKAFILALDCVGNKSAASKILSFQVSETTDVIGPTTPEFRYPDGADWIAGTPVTIRWWPSEDDNSGLCAYELSVDRSVVYTGLSTEYTLDSLVEGQRYEFDIVALDCAGNHSAHNTKEVTYDPTPPKPPTIMAPGEGQWFAAYGVGDFVWEQSEDDTSGACQYLIFVDGGYYGSITSTRVSGPSYMDDGEHGLEIYAYDCAGNIADEPATVTFYVDEQSPETPVFREPDVRLTWIAATSTFAWDAVSDGGAGLLGYELREHEGSVLYAGPASTWTPASAIADGMHVYELTAIDLVGNRSQAASLSFGVDQTPPYAPPVFLSPDNVVNWRTDPTLEFSWSPAQDATSGICNYALIVDEVPYYFGSAVSGLAFDFDDGAHHAIVRAYDCAGNVSEDNLGYFGIDANGPVAPVFTSPADGAWVEAQPTFTWSEAIDDASGVKELELRIDGENPVMLEGTATSYRPTTALAAGNHQITLFARDYADNESSTATLTMRVDNTPPLVPTFTAPAESSMLTSANPAFVWTASTDSDSGVCSYTILVDGQYGWVSTDGSTSGVLDQPLDEGQHTALIYARDCAGNRSESHTVNFSVDTLPPSAPVVTNPNTGVAWYTTLPEVVWQLSSDPDGSGVCGYRVLLRRDGSDHVLNEVDASTTRVTLTAPIPEGVVDLRVEAFDCAGNTSQTLATFAYDSMAPSAPAFTHPTEGEIVVGATVAFAWSAASDPTSGLCGYDLVIDSHDTYTYDAQTSGVPGLSGFSDGVHTAALQSVDCAGNHSEVSSVSFTVDTTVPDVTPPSTPVFVWPAEGAWVASAQPLIVWMSSIDGESGVCGYDLTLDGTLFAGLTETGFKPATPIVEGAHTVTLAAVDCEGNVSGAALLHFQTDSLTPVAAVPLMPADQACTDNPRPSFAWIACSDEGSGLDSQAFAWDGSLTTLDVSATSFTPDADLSEGLHIWALRCTDVADQSIGSTSFSLTVDLASPSLSVTTVGAEDDHIVGSGTSSSGSACAVLEVEVRVDDGSWEPVDLEPSTGAWTFETDLLSTGHHEVQVRAFTAYTEPVVSGVYSVDIEDVGDTDDTDTGAIDTDAPDTTPPTAPVFTGPSEGDWVADETPVISWIESTDRGAGVCGYDLTIDDVLYTPTHSPFTPYSAIADGLHTLSLAARDCAGNVSAPVELHFGTDNFAPEPAQVIMPEDASCTDNPRPPFVWMACTDAASGLAGQEFTFGAQTFPLDPSTTFITMPSDLAEGSYVWSVSCTDLVGLSTGSAVYSLTVDLGEPSLSVDQLQVLGDSVTLSGTASAGSACAVLGVEAQIDDEDWVPVNLDAGSGAWSFERAGLPLGDHSVIVRAFTTYSGPVWSQVFTLQIGSGAGDTDDTDTGSVDTDTGSVDTDTGSVDTDTGSVDTDTGSVDTDTGSVDTDTGSVDTDTGSVDTDTGSVDTDTGSGPIVTPDTDTDTEDTDTDTGATDTETNVPDTDTGKPQTPDTGDNPTVIDTDESDDAKHSGCAGGCSSNGPALPAVFGLVALVAVRRRRRAA